MANAKLGPSLIADRKRDVVVPVVRAPIDVRSTSLAILAGLGVVFFLKWASAVLIPIICWTHTRLPALANALGAREGKYSDPWDESVFNLILQLDYKQGGEPRVTQVRQPF